MFGSVDNPRRDRDLPMTHNADDSPPLIIAITGASGLIGTALSRFLETEGHQVRPVVRREAKNDEIGWSPSSGTIDIERLATVDVVVHLASESLIGIRWTDEKKRRIRESRVNGTRLIAEAMSQIDDGPRVLLSASGANYYGDTGDKWVDESSPPGKGFLAEVCQAWEDAAQPARDAGIRVVHLRQGPILSAKGGALKQMLPAFKMGMGGNVGSGKQYFPWISMEDELRAIRHLIDSDLDGPVNIVSPNPVTNAEFTETLGQVLERPTFMKLPGFAVKAALGQMGEETLLGGPRVRPARLLESGFEFLYAELENALRAALDH